MKKYKAILHDWDDTIVNSLQTYSTWYQDFADYYGLPAHDFEIIKGLWGSTLAEILINLYPQFSSEKVTEMANCFENINAQKFIPQPFPGVVNLVEKLVKNGLVVGIISVGGRTHLKRVYQHAFNCSFHEFHEFVICDDDVPFHKPDPRVFDTPIEILAPLGINPTEILYVGDLLDDYMAASKRGIDFVGVTTGLHTKEQFQEAGLKADCILKSFKDLGDYLS